MHPELSVLIPAYNAEPFLAEAVASVRSQTVKLETEILIYNDGSTDGTAEVISSFGSGVASWRNDGPPAGPAVGRNALLSRAQGRLVAFLDADDLWLPDKLAKQLAVLKRTDEPVAVFGSVQEFDANGPLGEYRAGALTSASLLKRELALSVGPFEPSLQIGDFADWLSRLKDRGVRFDYSAGPVARRRNHADNLGKRMAGNRNDYLQVIRRKLQRERTSS